MIGVPTAPKVTAETSATRARHTAAIAGKPSAISRGAATVAGVPNPAAPSMKHTSSQPTNSIWMRLSGVTRRTSSRIRASAPLARITPEEGQGAQDDQHHRPGDDQPLDHRCRYLQGGNAPRDHREHDRDHQRDGHGAGGRHAQDHEQDRHGEHRHECCDPLRDGHRRPPLGIPRTRYRRRAHAARCGRRRRRRTRDRGARSGRPRARVANYRGRSPNSPAIASDRRVCHGMPGDGARRRLVGMPVRVRCGRGI